MTAGQQVISEELDYVCRFLELLQAENQCLKSGALEDLEAISRRKSILIPELEAKTRTRLAFFEITDPARATLNTERWFSENPHEREALKSWQKLLQEAAKARDLHKANELLVSLLLQRTSAALDILVQRQREQTTYSSNGQATTPTGSRIIDSA